LSELKDYALDCFGKAGCRVQPRGSLDESIIARPQQKVGKWETVRLHSFVNAIGVRVDDLNSFPAYTRTLVGRQVVEARHGCLSLASSLDSRQE
jgi:hypothetical protein